jgi:hypothetical protein
MPHADLRAVPNLRGFRSRSGMTRMSDEVPVYDHPGVKQTVDRNAKGREAPMVIRPRDLVRLVKQVVGTFRSSDSRRPKT